MLGFDRSAMVVQSSFPQRSRQFVDVFSKPTSTRRSSLLLLCAGRSDRLEGCWGGYPKNSDDSPNTRERERVLNTFKHRVRAQSDCDSLYRLHKFPKVWIRLHVPSRPLL
jgi:hypothetical protein